MSSSVPQCTFSVVVCTYDRNRWLPELFDSLAAQDLDADEFEVLVVDNGSPQPAQREVEAAAARYPQHDFRCVVEANLGLAAARNRAVADARGHWLAFLDDDCRPPPDWLRSRARAIDEAALRPAVVAGPTHPKFLASPPAWFDPAWVTVDAGGPPRSVRRAWGEVTLTGSNLVLRRDVAGIVGGFDTERPHRGMVGERLGVGEETRLIAKILAQPELGPVLWDPRAPVLDLVFPEHTTTAYCARRAFANGQLVAALEAETRGWGDAPPADLLPSRPKVVGTLLGDLAAILLGPAAERHLSVCRIAERCGRALEALRIRPRFRQRPRP